MRFASLFLLASLALAQRTMQLSAPSSARPGQSIALAVSVPAIAGQTNTGMSAGQWTMAAPPAGITLPLPSAGAAATSATKIVQCDSTRRGCIVFGCSAVTGANCTGTANNNVIPNGSLAMYLIAIPPNQPAGNLTFALTSTIGADINGSSVVVTPGPSITVKVLGQSDINGDGVTDMADVNAMLAEVIASVFVPTACAHDQNGDSKCDALDLVLVIKDFLAQPVAGVVDRIEIPYGAGQVATVETLHDDLEGMVRVMLVDDQHRMIPAMFLDSVDPEQDFLVQRARPYGEYRRWPPTALFGMLVGGRYGLSPIYVGKGLPDARYERIYRVSGGIFNRVK